MANPQVENGHIDIANEIADKLCSYRLSGQEWQIIWAILRKTWGWLTDPKDKNSPKKKMDRIALSQFEQLTGIDRRKCHVLLKKLIVKKIIKKTITQKGDNIVITYGFQKNFDLWKVSPKKVTITQKGDGVSPKRVSNLSPKKVNTKDTLKETFTKDKELTAFDNAENNQDFYLTRRKKKLSGKRLETFMQFWDAFDYKSGKAEASDIWLEFPSLTNTIVDEIITAAKREALDRPELISSGKTPKMAQGWLSGRRWEDEISENKTQGESINGTKLPKVDYSDIRGRDD